MPFCMKSNCNKLSKQTFWNPDHCGNHRPRYNERPTRYNKIKELAERGATYDERQNAKRLIEKYYSIEETDYEKIINKFLQSCIY